MFHYLSELRYVCFGVLGLFVLGMFACTSGPWYYMLVGKENIVVEESIVVVTGCDSGFGLDMALDLNAKGFVVVALCLTKEGATRLKRTRGIHVIQGDVTKIPDIVELVSLVMKTSKRLGPAARLYAVINNAGVAPMGHVAWMPDKVVRHAMEVNYFGVLNVIRGLLPMLKSSPGSRVINISSMAGVAGGPMFGAYSASKFALQGLSVCLREELKPWKVWVSNVNPAFMKTPMLDSSIQQAKTLFEAAPRDVRQQYDEELIFNDGQKVMTVAENPELVVRYVTNVIIPSKRPHFYNPIGVQAGILRWMLLLPKNVIELLVYMFSPSFVKEKG